MLAIILCSDFNFSPCPFGIKDSLYPGKTSFQAKVLSDKLGLPTWREVFSWKQWFLPPTRVSLLSSGCFNSRCKESACGRRQVAKLVGSLFCFYFLIFIATFHAQQEELRDPDDSTHVPSFQAVQSLFSSGQGSPWGRKWFQPPRNKWGQEGRCQAGGQGCLSSSTPTLRHLFQQSWAEVLVVSAARKRLEGKSACEQLEKLLTKRATMDLNLQNSGEHLPCKWRKEALDRKPRFKQTQKSKPPVILYSEILK